MSKFAEAHEIISLNEGNKITNDKHDKGGLTNAGITYPFYRDRCERVFKVKPSLAHFKALSDEAKQEIYKDYWNGLALDMIYNSLIAAFIFDFCVNSGKAIREIQEMLNAKFGCNVKIDNVLGLETIAAINIITSSKAELLYCEMKLTRLKYMWELGMEDKTQRTFWPGWFKRVLFFGM